ncbi:MAG: UDP-glucose 4-epimerase GalE, partial [Rhizobium leguminosarum]|nr:UDP-glucose 4-epimerase GalE [Rhizobium leguminosarum]
GTSVREILEAIRRASGREVPVNYRARRAGDPPILFANTARAKAELGFAPVLSDIDTIIRTAGPTFGLEMRA